ncbi:MAG: hypothetical protein RBT69_00855 [Spirochaetia bacterium]|jgi:hypothetical protein|nr:hypothetical protein [Spirochaetia bacterium]
MKINTLILTLLLLLSHPVFSENIRGPVKNIAVINQELSKIDEINLSPEDIFAFQLDKNSALPVKIQLEIRLSEKLREYPSTFALFVYNNITPVPSNEISSYNGNSVKYFILPDKSRYYIELFFTAKPSRNDILPGTEILIPDDFKKSFFPLLMTVLPVMKGIPDALLDENIRIKAVFFYQDKGDLTINVFEDKKNRTDKISDFTLFIDNKSYDNAENINLSTGIKKIRIEKEGFLPFEQSVVINRNEKSTVSVVLVKKMPQVVILAPAEAEVFIDGNLTSQKELTTLNEGEHTIIFKLGQYSLSRKLNLENGKKYTVNLLLDIDVVVE